MKKIYQVCIALFCSLVIASGVLTFSGESSKAYAAAGGETMHDSIATKYAMKAVGSSMSKILDGLLNGDFDVVIKESNKISRISEYMVDMYFPDDEWGLVGRKFKMSDKSMKAEYEKYAKEMAAATKNLADTAKNGDSMETYEVFDSLLRNLCFECHNASRTDWPVRSK
ncbi:MAG: cytochrome c [Candidatus Scalindua rubra]|uniref:Cytochrome c n=1 Tax=Candidatus Scalindua brodae TaxID=237368 RepID=A0A0B0EM19_9BACT|nr:MAG: hypothetical protein SCABRO_00117 [Candidatus Scalindua brodae]MBZ0109408.1 cytochrome c [Candidatus Scalindua rubra]TWU34804.1 Cytochrome C' [Candidatus Brocadiaceae bacterium S225]